MPLSYIRNKIASLKKQISTFIAVQGFFQLLLIFGIIAVISFVLDYLLHFPLDVRKVLLGIYTAYVLYVFIKHTYKPFFTPISDEQIALSIEQNNPELRDRLISALQFSRLLDDPNYQDSREMTLSVIKETEELSKDIRFSSILDFEKLISSMIAPTVLAFFIVGISFIFPKWAFIWFERNILVQNVEWPRNTTMFVIKEEFDTSLGKDVEISIKNNTPAASLKVWYRKEKASALTLWRKVKAVKKDKLLSAVLPKISKNTYFYLETEKATSGFYLLRPEKNVNAVPIQLEFPNLKFARARGERLVVIGVPKGLASDTARIYYRLESSQEWHEEPMGRQGKSNVFRYVFPSLSEKMSFYITGGDDVDEYPVYEVQVLNPPAIDSVKAWYKFPAYTGLKASEKPQDHGNIKAIEGTEIQLKIRSSLAVVKGMLHFSKRHKNLLPSKTLIPEKNGQDILTNFKIKFNTNYTISLMAANGLENPSPPSYNIRVIKDRRPYVKIIIPNKSYISMLVGSTLPVEFSATDDFGITKVKFLYRINREQKWKDLELSEKNLTQKNEGREILGKYDLVLPTFKVEKNIEQNTPERELQKGDSVSFKIRAYDNNTISGPGIKESDVYVVEIVDKTELLRKLNERLLHVKRQLTKIAELQQEKKETLTEFINLESKIEVGDLSKILKQRFAQRKIARDIRELSKDLKDVLWISDNNSLWDAGTRNRVDSADKLLVEIHKEDKKAPGLSSKVEKQLMDAYNTLRGDEKKGRDILRDAVSGQDDTYGNIQEAIQLLGEWEDTHEIVRDIEGIFDMEDKLHNTLKEHAKNK